MSNALASEKESPVSGEDLATLKSGTKAYLGIRDDLYEIANAYECVVDVP